jgi:ribonucleotide monophosphatase NagD (HAD superfamily)
MQPDMTAPAAPAIRDLYGLMPFYDVFVLDQFGTLNDASTLYPGVAELLRALRAAGKRVATLSNSGKRAAENWRRLHRLGVPDGSFDVVLTSGEVGHTLIAAGADDAGIAADCRRYGATPDGVLDSAA